MPYWIKAVDPKSTLCGIFLRAASSIVAAMLLATLLAGCDRHSSQDASSKPLVKGDREICIEGAARRKKEVGRPPPYNQMVSEQPFVDREGDYADAYLGDTYIKVPLGYAHSIDGGYHPKDGGQSIVYEASGPLQIDVARSLVGDDQIVFGKAGGLSKTVSTFPSNGFIGFNLINVPTVARTSKLSMKVGEFNGDTISDFAVADVDPLTGRSAKTARYAAVVGAPNRAPKQTQAFNASLEPFQDRESQKKARISRASGFHRTSSNLEMVAVHLPNNRPKAA